MPNSEERQEDVPPKKEKRKEPEQKEHTGLYIGGLGMSSGSDEENTHVPLWLITFTDVMALMLTFFVLLYAMSSPQKDKWEKITTSLGTQFTKQFSRPFHNGDQDTINIDRISTTRALDLKYLKTLIDQYIKQEGLKDFRINQQKKRLVISLPSDLLFESGSADIETDAKKSIFSLGGILSRIHNRIEIAGHTDPSPLAADAPYHSNWELSLARSVSVAALLRESGYDREITVKGLSSGRYDELPENMTAKEKQALSRRVDVIIMSDGGVKNKFLNLQ